MMVGNAHLTQCRGAVPAPFGEIMYKYQIGDKTYVQKKLVLGQWRQLLDLLKGLSVPQDLDAREIVSVFGDKLPYAPAIVLVEEGKSLREKDIVAPCIAN
jgi:hypothetical protein